MLAVERLISPVNPLTLVMLLVPAPNTVIKPLAAISRALPAVNAPIALELVKYKLEPSAILSVVKVPATVATLATIKPFAAITIPEPPVNAPIALELVKYKLEPSAILSVVKVPATVATLATIKPFAAITIPEPPVNAPIALELVKYKLEPSAKLLVVKLLNVDTVPIKLPIKDGLVTLLLVIIVETPACVLVNVAPVLLILDTDAALLCTKPVFGFNDTVVLDSTLVCWTDVDAVEIIKPFAAITRPDPAVNAPIALALEK